jgi:hypothetical protein
LHDLDGLTTLNRTESEAIEKRLACAAGELNAELREAARRLLMQELREVLAC